MVVFKVGTFPVFGYWTQNESTKNVRMPVSEVDVRRSKLNTKQELISRLAVQIKSLCYPLDRGL